MGKSGYGNVEKQGQNTVESTSNVYSPRVIAAIALVSN